MHAHSPEVHLWRIQWKPYRDELQTQPTDAETDDSDRHVRGLLLQEAELQPLAAAWQAVWDRDLGAMLLPLSAVSRVLVQLRKEKTGYKHLPDYAEHAYGSLALFWLLEQAISWAL